MSNAQAIWSALINAGATPIQAAGIMGNMFYESTLDPESSVIDSNGLRSVGLIQWNAGTYPNAGSLLTGNVSQDIVSQVNYLAQTGGFKAASGTTASQAGSNFAANYERCEGCQSGGQQNGLRAAQAAAYYSASQTGDWPTSGATGSSATDTASLTGSSYNPATCVAGLSLPGATSLLPWTSNSSTGLCVLTKTEARALIGGLLIATSVIFTLAGSAILVAYGFKKTGAATAVGGAFTAVAGPTRVIGNVVKRAGNSS